MKRLMRTAVAVGLSMDGVLFLGCSSEVQLELRDAAVSGAATFVEQQTLQLLTSLLGSQAEK